MAKWREQRRREIEKRKLEITVRHRILAEVLTMVGAPLDRANLLLIASAMLDRIDPLRRETLARRCKIVKAPPMKPATRKCRMVCNGLRRHIDENGFSKLIIEIVLSGSVEPAAQGGNDLLTTTAKRCRVDVA